MSEERPVEVAPSNVRADEMGATQLVGLTGMGLAALGAIVVVANQFGPRVLTAGAGYLLAAFGLVAMFYHALRDSSLEIRRAYLFFGAGLVLLAIVSAIVPGPLFGEVKDKQPGYHFLPWSPLFGFLGLIFLVTPLRHETDAKILRYGLTALLAVGGTLSIGAVGFGIAKPDSLVGPGILMGILGLGFLAAFLSLVETADGPGHLVASMLGLLGAGALLYAFGRSVFPTVLFEGSQALKNAYQAFDIWKVLARAGIVLVFAGVGGWGARNKTWPGWLRAGFAVVGLGFAAVFVVAATTPVALESPKPFFVPNGLLLAALGLVYLAVSVGIVSDSPFVAMTRRELAGYFYSPIAYIVLLGMAVIQFVGYWLFLSLVVRTGATGARSFPEPILQAFVPGTFIGPIAVIFLVPALTMRLFSEERRSGTMEVLITAPVNEWQIVLSKFLGSWFFYMLTWVPMGLYLLGLRFEGGAPFDYRPLLGLYIAIGVTGLGFIAMGLFFSSLTKNQIIAAVLTFMAMLLMLALYWNSYFARVGEGFIRELMNALAIGSYWTTWETAAGGQLPVRDLVLHGSLAVFWLFLTVKSLETRKWG
jgi:ABC-2 type transport system permease protein